MPVTKQYNFGSTRTGQLTISPLQVMQSTANYLACQMLSVDQSIINQYNSNLAAREPDSK